MPAEIRKFALSISIIFFIAIIVMPLIIGVWVKHEYDALITFYNSQEGVHIDVKKYDRHWFSANVELDVSLNAPWVQQLSDYLNAQDVALPATLKFSVQQHIQNGPILFRQNEHVPVSVQLAYMYSEIHFAPQLANVIKLIDTYQAPIIIVDNLSFNGKFQRNFRSAGLTITLPGDNKKIEVRSLNAQLAIWPIKRRVAADIKTADLLFLTPNLQVSIPDSEIKFDTTQSAHNLWLGKSGFAFSHIYVRDEHGSTLAISNINSIGELTESGDMLTITRQFHIDKVDAGEELIGPINLRMNAHDLDATIMAKIFSTYGPMLFSNQYMIGAAQLLTSLPDALNGDSAIDIEDLSVGTPNGNLDITGKVEWPGLLAGARLSDVVEHTHAQALVRVGVPLATRIAQAVVDMSYATAAAMPAPAPEVVDKKTLAAVRQYELVIAMLKENHQVPVNAADNLLTQQKNHASIDDFQLVLDGMVAQKQISQTTADTLRGKYAATQWMTMAPDQRRDSAQKLLTKQMANWVQQGYITQDKNDYLSTILFQDGQVSVNGKVVERAY
jgi:uncharacterized protein YdgA (DUF945 family)